LLVHSGDRVTLPTWNEPFQRKAPAITAPTQPVGTVFLVLIVFLPQTVAEQVGTDPSGIFDSKKYQQLHRLFVRRSRQRPDNVPVIQELARTEKTGSQFQRPTRCGRPGGSIFMLLGGGVFDAA
jgi:hypothetical protein